MAAEEKTQGHLLTHPSAGSEATSALAPTPDLGPWTWSGPPSAWEFGVSYKDADTCPPRIQVLWPNCPTHEETGFSNSQA